MKKLLIYLTITMVTLSSSMGFAQQENTNLKGLLEHVLSVNPEIKRDRSIYFSSVESLAQSKANYRPTILLDADATHNHTQSEGNTAFTEEGGNLSKKLSTSLSQPLYRGGSTLADIKEKKNTISAQYWLLNKKYQDIALDTITAYWEVYVQQSEVDLNIKNTSLLGQRLKETQARFEAGELTKTDVSQAQARLAEAEADLATAQGAWEKAKATLGRLAGLSVVKIEHPDLNPDLPESMDRALNDAMSLNPDIRRIKLVKEASQNTIRSIKGEFLPQINLGLSSSKSYDPAPGFLEEEDSQTVQVTASIPLYTGGATRSRLRQAHYNDKANEYDIEDIEDHVREQVIASWSNYKTSGYSLTARKKQVEATSIAAEGVKKEHKYGVRTIIDLLDSDQEHLDAQVNLIRAERDLMIAGFDLARQIGALSPDTFMFKNTLPNNTAVMKNIGGNWLGFDVDYPE